MKNLELTKKLGQELNEVLGYVQEKEIANMIYVEGLHDIIMDKEEEIISLKEENKRLKSIKVELIQYTNELQRELKESDSYGVALEKLITALL